MPAGLIDSSGSDAGPTGGPSIMITATGVHPSLMRRRRWRTSPVASVSQLLLYLVAHCLLKCVLRLPVRVMQSPCIASCTMQCAERIMIEATTRRPAGSQLNLRKVRSRPYLIFFFLVIHSCDTQLRARFSQGLWVRLRVVGHVPPSWR